MITIFSFIQTMLLTVLPYNTNEFNISFSSDHPGKQLCCGQNHGVLPCLQDSAIAPFAASLETGRFFTSVSLETAKIEKELDKNEYQLKTVVIDAGHGGHDPGCSGSDSREKHLALGVALKLADYLKTRFPDLNVILTRDKDVFIPLHERARIANRNNADLFISIHCNFFPSSNKVRGTETYVMGLHTAEHNLDVAKRENAAILLEDDYEKNYDYDPNSPEGHIMLSIFQNAYLEQSILFAELVEQSFAERAERRSRGVRQAGFVVLKETAMPSILIETGFLSNFNEEQFLKSNAGQERIAQAIGDAFADYKKMVEGEIAAPPAAADPIIAQQQPSPQSPPIIKDTPAADAMKGNLVLTENQFDLSENNPSPQPVKVAEQKHSSPSVATQPKTPQYQEMTPENILSPKEPVANTKKQDLSPAPPANDKYQFYVQLAAATQPIDTRNGIWKLINYQVEVIIEGRLLKYRARTADNLQKAIEDRDHLRQLGFTDAFLVAYKNGEKISIEHVK